MSPCRSMRPQPCQVTPSRAWCIFFGKCWARSAAVYRCRRASLSGKNGVRQLTTDVSKKILPNCTFVACRAQYSKSSNLILQYLCVLYNPTVIVMINWPQVSMTQKNRLVACLLIPHVFRSPPSGGEVAPRRSARLQSCLLVPRRALLHIHSGKSQVTLRRGSRT